MAYAARVTNVAANLTQSVVSDNPITVYQIIIVGVTAVSQITILDKDNNTLFTMSAGNGTSQKMSIPFKADNGLRVSTPSTGTATVFHSHPGT